MRDADVRSALLTKLSSDFAGDATTRIVEEMGIWSGSTRIDVAVINGRLHGYELKSARDTLERLDGQADMYNQVFDNVTLVTAGCHLPQALDKIPRWWGVVLATEQEDGQVLLHERRKARNNPRINPLQAARLLWRPELLDLLTRYGHDRGVRSGTVEAMARRAAERLPLHILLPEVRATLKSRREWLR